MIRGVLPSQFCASISAPLSIKSLATSKFPVIAAKCKGVFLCYFKNKFENKFKKFNYC